MFITRTMPNTLPLDMDNERKPEFGSEDYKWLVVPYWLKPIQILVKQWLILLISSLIHWLFSDLLFSFYIFVNVQLFLFSLICIFIPLKSENILGIIATFSNLVMTCFMTYQMI